MTERFRSRSYNESVNHTLYTNNTFNYQGEIVLGQTMTDNL
jgi:hypothetical protein